MACPSALIGASNFFELAVAAAISPMTAEFLRDIAATNIENAIEYGVGTRMDTDDARTAGPVGDGYNDGIRSIRIRGLPGGGRSINFFGAPGEVDMYMTEGLEVSRGPNSILYGFGSPAGRINIASKQAQTNKNAYSFSNRLDSWGGERWIATAWTAIGIWLGPVRSTLDYGQINVVLVLLILLAVHTNRWWLSGLLVGLAAGVKLTPAVAGLYFLGVRRWAAAAFSVVVFAATVAVSWLVVRDQATYYFTELLGDARRVGPIGTSFNQSWRGGISRIVGHDAGYGAPVLAALAVTAVLAWLAWRAVASDSDRQDRLGLLLVVQLFGLLLSPISWTHHWVWLLPLMIWLLHGPYRYLFEARLLGWGWLVLTLVGVPWLLSFAQPTIWQIGRPWYLAWAGLIYIVATMVTLAWIAAVRLRFPGGRRSCRYRQP